MEEVEKNRIRYIGDSLVREYLTIKGLQSTLRCLDLEYPRRGHLRNRTELAKEFGFDCSSTFIEDGTHANKFQSVLELVIYNFLKNGKLKSVKQLINQNKTCGDSVSGDDKLIKNMNFVDLVDKVKEQNISLFDIQRNIIKTNCETFKNLLRIPCGCACLQYKQGPKKKDPNFESIKTFLNVVSGGRSRYTSKDSEESNTGYHDYNSPDNSHEYTSTHNSREYPKIHTQAALREKEDILMSSIRKSPDYLKYDNQVRLGPSKLNIFQCLKQPESSFVDEGSNMDETTVAVDNKVQNDKDQNIPNEKGFNLTNPIIIQCEDTELTENNNLIFQDEKEHSDTYTVRYDLHVQENSLSVASETISADGDSDATGITCTVSSEASTDISNRIDPDSSNHQLSKASENDKEAASNVRITDFSSDDILFSKCKIIDKKDRDNFNAKIEETAPNKSIEKTNKEKIAEKKSEAKYIIEEDIISAEEFTPIESGLEKILRKIIFDSEEFGPPSQWFNQSFVFNKNKKFKFGLIQNKSGPCGVLATVQAYVLKALLFDPLTTTVCPQPLCPTQRELHNALIQALAEILWQAGEKRYAVLAKLKKGEETSTFSSNLMIKKFYTLQKLHDAIEENVSMFTTDNFGCFLLVVSAVLSSGINRVLENSTIKINSLIQKNGFCSLELVTLLLTGHAVSNLFDNKITEGPIVSQGISKRSTIGFLSIHEYFKTCQIGSNLKTPRYPIWVVNSDNHYSVIFSDNRKLVSDWRAERLFCVNHYDTLDSNKEDFKISIDTTGHFLIRKEEGEYISPLELCLSTKWKDAIMNWVISKPA